MCVLLLLFLLLFSMEGCRARVVWATYDYNYWWGTKTEWYRVGCPFHLDGRTVALENLRSNCIVRDSGGHLQRYWRSWYIRFCSLAPGKQLVYRSNDDVFHSLDTLETPYKIILLLKCLIVTILRARTLHSNNENKFCCALMSMRVIRVPTTTVSLQSAVRKAQFTRFYFCSECRWNISMAYRIIILLMYTDNKTHWFTTHNTI